MPTEKYFAALTRFRDAVIPRRWQHALMTPRGLLVGFLVVHVGFLVFALIVSLQGNAFSDTNIYRDWAAAGFDEANLPSGPSPWVYPVLAQVFIFLPRVMGHDLYLLGWTLMITALNAVAMWFLLHRAHRPARGELPGLVGDGPSGVVHAGTDAGDPHGSSAVQSRRRGAVVAGWWWVVFTVFLGYLSFARVEGVAAPIMLVGLLYAVRRPAVGSALLSVATWIKVWPAAAILAMVVALRQRVRVVLAGVAVTAAVVAGVLVLGGIERIADFALNQGSRGMQLEATFSTPWVWGAVLGIEGFRIADNTAINSTEVYGPGVETTASLMQPLLLEAVVLSAALLIRALRPGADRARLF